MDRNTFVIHNLHFESGCLWGEFAAVAMAYVENITGRRISTLAHVTSGSSIGGVTALALGHGRVTASVLAQAMFVCGTDLFEISPEKFIKRQILKHQTGGHYWAADHIDQNILGRMLEAYFNGAVMNDAAISVLLPSHNMTLRRNEMFGKLDYSLFDTAAMRTTFVNGRTKMIDAAMATSCLPAVFEAYEVEQSHYRDLATVITPGNVHKELQAMADARHVALRRARHGGPVSRRNVISLFGAGARGPLRMDNAERVIVRTHAFGAGDLTNIPYDNATQRNAGIYGIVGHDQYGALQAMKNAATQQDIIDAERYFNPASRAALGRDAVIRIDKSLIPANEMERKRFPNLKQTDASFENFLKIFQFAGAYVDQNRSVLAQMVSDITDSQLAQDVIDPREHKRMKLVCEKIARDQPWEHLDDVLVTAANADSVRAKFNAHGAPRRKTIVGRVAQMAAGGAARFARPLRAHV